MSRNKLILCLTIVFLLLIPPPNIFVRANNCVRYSFKYPYATDSPEWKSYSRQQRVDACQIPEDILQGMATDALIDTVIGYPMRADLIVFNFYRAGFLRIYQDFNGLRELASRPDAASQLLAKYRAIDFGQNTIYDLIYLEILLAQHEITSHAEPQVIREIEEEVQRKHTHQELSNMNIYYRAVDEQRYNIELD